MSAVPGRSEEDSVVPLVWKDPAPTSTNPAGAGAKNNSAPACRTKPNERPAIEPAPARRNWPPAAPDSYESTPSPYADTMKDVTRPSNCLFKKRPGSERRRVEVATRPTARSMSAGRQKRRVSKQHPGDKEQTDGQDNSHEGHHDVFE